MTDRLIERILEKVFITGVSFTDTGVEIIYLDEDENTEHYGFLHTVYLKTDAGELKESFDLIQAELRHLIDTAYDLKLGRQKQPTLKDRIEQRQSSRDVFDIVDDSDNSTPVMPVLLEEDPDDDDGEETGFVRTVRNPDGTTTEERLF